MGNYDPDFIQRRLEWRLSQHGGPYTSTGLWADAPAALRERLSDQLVRPIIYSISAKGDATIIGVRQLCILTGSGAECIDLDLLEDVTSKCIEEGKDKLEFDVLSVTVGGVEVRLPTEMGAPCFAVWNTILSLVRMKKDGKKTEQQVF